MKKFVNRNVISRRNSLYTNMPHQSKVLLQKIFGTTVKFHLQLYKLFTASQKIRNNLSNPPGRPIVSRWGSLTEKGNQVIDSYLRPHLYSLNAFIKDTIEFLRTIDLLLPQGAWLVATDVKTLYSSIPHDLGIHAVAHFLKACDRNQWALNVVILQALEFVLRNNLFTFDDNIFLQTQGVSYVNLYQGWWELVAADDSLLMYLCHAEAWHRYIDYVFMVHSRKSYLFRCLGQCYGVWWFVL